LGVLGPAIDKIWPDKADALAAETEKEGFKTKLQLAVIQQALQEKSLLFQDTEGARKVAIAELTAKQVPSWARGIQVMGRPFALYATVSMYIWAKIGPLVGQLLGREVPAISLSQPDYYLIGTVFCFLFGARTLEKLKGRA
jgi:hypothetical protein